MNKKRILWYVLCFICISCSFAGPFGLEMGMSLAQVKESCGGRDPVPVADDRYQIVPQKVYPSFIMYIAWINETEGLYYLKALSPAVSTSSYGIELKNEFTRIKILLIKTMDRTAPLMHYFPAAYGMMRATGCPALFTRRGIFLLHGVKIPVRHYRIPLPAYCCRHLLMILQQAAYSLNMNLQITVRRKNG